MHFNNIVDDPYKIEDNFGRQIFYSVGQKKTVSKIKALEWAEGDITKIAFHWRENEFDKIDWTIEPVRTLEEIVDEYVQTIRNNNDHVALWYSGGFDSHTILLAFARNNLIIDELIVFDREWEIGEAKVDGYLAMQSALAVKNKIYPKIKISTVSWRISDVIKFYEERKLDWIYHAGEVLRFSKHSRSLLFKHNEDVIALQDRPQRSIMINGVDKPRLSINDGNWYARRNDTIFHFEFDEPALQFWLQKELYVKQCYMMLRWIESLPAKDINSLEVLVHQIQGHKCSSLMYNYWNMSIGRKKPFFEYQTTNLDKKKWRGTTCVESSFLKKYMEKYRPDIYNWYNLSLGHLKKKFHNIYNDGFPTFLSKPYLLRPVKLMQEEKIIK